MAFSPSYVFLVFLCGLVGFGGGLYHPAGTALVSGSFERTERGRVLGVHASAGAFGILLTFVVVGGIASHSNWRTAVIFLSFIGFGLAACFKLLLRNVERNSGDGEQQRVLSENDAVGFWSLIRWLPYMLFIYGIVLFVVKGAYTWIPTYLKEAFNLTSGTAIMFSVILPSTGIFSNYLMGRFSDHYGRKLSLVLVFGSLIFVFALLFLGKRSFLIPLLIVLGFFLNSFSGIINAYVGDFLPSRLLGKAFGILFTFSTCISALAPYIMGLISDRSSLSVSILFLGIVSLVRVIAAMKSPKKFAVRSAEASSDADRQTDTS